MYMAASRFSKFSSRVWRERAGHGVVHGARAVATAVRWRTRAGADWRTACAPLLALHDGSFKKIFGDYQLYMPLCQ
eukprot:scaffold11699_cov109-Isochrysis_galbana.AAC.3